MAGRDDLVDEGGPVVRPLLFEDGNEDHVELVDQGSLLAQTFVGARHLDDELDNKVANALALLAGQNLPSSHDHIVKDL